MSHSDKCGRLFMKSGEKSGFTVGGASQYFEGTFPTYAHQSKVWCKDVFTLYDVLNIDEQHWVALVISIDERTVTVYDCIRGNKNSIEKLAGAFADMVPHLLSEMVPGGYLAKPAYTVKVEDPSLGSPEMQRSIGDCGVYTLKFLECLMMDVSMDKKDLCNANMQLFGKSMRWI